VPCASGDAALGEERATESMTMVVTSVLPVKGVAQIVFDKQAYRYYRTRPIQLSNSHNAYPLVGLSITLA
jgi:hypothetical protein